jgi:signal peptidase I
MTTDATRSIDVPRVRRAWLAALLSLIWPGVGQLYAGRLQKALILWAVWAILIGSAVAIADIAPPTPGTFEGVQLLLLLVLGVAIYAAIDAFRQARRQRISVLKRYQRVWVYFLAIIPLHALADGAAYSIGSRSFSIPGPAMLPTVEPGDYIFVRPLDGQGIRRGDLVVFHLPRDRRFDYFKRIIGVPGDRIELRSGVVYVNDQPLPQQHVQSIRSEQHLYTETSLDGRGYEILRSLPGDNGQWTVPSGQYFVLGDNRDHSYDSRDPRVGFVPIGDVIGEAGLIWWSRSADRIGMRLQ